MIRTPICVIIIQILISFRYAAARDFIPLHSSSSKHAGSILATIERKI